MRLNLRVKLLLFAVAIALLPLAISGQSLIRTAQDELKSSANEQLVATARQIRDEIENVYANGWVAPLRLIANALDKKDLGVEQKIALLTLGIGDLAGVVALQVTPEGDIPPVVVTKSDFSQRLAKHKLSPKQVLTVDPAIIMDMRANSLKAGRRVVNRVDYVEASDDWLATLALPLKNKLAGRDATVSARISLRRLRGLITRHPFTKTGEINLVDAAGKRVFDARQTDLKSREIVARALTMLPNKTGVIAVSPYTRPSGDAMLGAIALPRPFDWAVLVEKTEQNAYYAIGVMISSLLVWLSVGLAAAALGAVLFSLRMSRPILAIGRAASEVGKGNFDAKVENVTSRDEIGDLANRINQMISELNERFQLQKFVSAGTMDAIKQSDREGVKLGGVRRKVCVLFADIRGYTAFSETRDPETVVEVLNHYFQRQADLVSKHHGDIDKFVGDQIMAVFQGRNMVRDATRCALEIQQAMGDLAADYPDAELTIGIGIDTGEVVMGAMGSKARMDYTVLGDHVNLAARLCSSADPQQTLLSADAARALGKAREFSLAKLEPIRVKGKSKRIEIFAVSVKQ